MQNKVLATIEKYNMLKVGEPVLVGLSGGADSVSLSLCLKKLGYDVFAVHVNHCLRGEESDRDEAFCRSFCADNDIELVVHRVNVSDYCKEKKLSLELGARELRYDVFQKTMKQLNINKLATAHNLSDCLETTILNLVRGCSVKGLCGIPPVRENIIRPLIDCTREEIEKYLSENNQEYVTDSSNLVDDCSRNIIRLNVLPQLKRINSGIYKSYLSSLDNFRTVSSQLDASACSIIKDSKISENSYDVHKLFSVKQPVLGTAVGMILGNIGVEPSSDRIERIISLCESEGKLTLSENLYAECKNGILRLYRQEACKNEVFSQNISVGENVSCFGKRVSVRYTDKSDFSFNVHKKFTKNIIDCDKIKGVLVVRNRRNGDKIRLSNRKVTSSVKTLFNASVPLEKRDKVVFLADDDGVIFIEGFGVAERVSPDNSSVRLAEIIIASCH